MNKDIVQSIYAAFAKGDIPSVLAAMDAQVAWTEAEGFPITGTFIGPQAVLEGVFMRLGDVIGDAFGVEIEQLVAEGDTVVALGWYAWRHKRTAQACRVRLAHVITLAGGKVTRFQQHVDSARVRELIA